MPTYTFGLQSGTTSSTGTVDVGLYQEAPSANTGSDATLYGRLGNTTNEDNLCFGFGGLGAIPGTDTLVSATLTLKGDLANSAGAATGGGYSTAVYRLLQTFTGSANWTSRNGTDNWTTAGANGAGTDRAGTATDTESFGATINYDVTADIATIRAASGTTAAWLLKDVSGNTSAYFGIFSAESGTSGNRPLLTIVTTAGAAAPVLSSPTAAATGNTTASASFSTTGTDGTAYAVRSAAQPTNTQIIAGQDSTGAASSAGSLAITSSGSKTIPLTGVAVPTGSQTVWFLHRPAAGSSLDSNVPSATWTQPAALAWSGTYPNQSGVAGAAFVHSGSIPTPTGGVGTRTYSATGLGASGLTPNPSTGQLQGTNGTAGTYNITPTVTDSSTAGSPNPQTVSLAAFTLTISAAGTAPTVSANPTNLTVTSGSTAGFAGGFNGTPTLSLQWQEFISGVWTAMSGQTTTNLSLGAVTLGDTGRSFRLGCTNSFGGPIYTASATLTVTAASVGTITSDVLADWGNDTPLASLNIPFVTVERTSDAAVVLQLTNQITGTNGKLVLTNAAIVPGIAYMLALRDATGNVRGYKRYVAT